MRIAHIVSTYPPYYGGMGNVVFQTASELAKLGHEVEVFTPQYEKPMPEGEVTPALQERIDYARRLKPSIAYGNAARLPQIKSELDTFDLVHLHYPFFGTANLVRKWKLRQPEKPLVITYHMDTRAPGWKGLFFKYYSAFWMPKILRAADLLLVSSFDYLKRSQAGRIYESQKQKWQELPFGVDTERFKPRDKPGALLNRHELSPNLPILLFVGAMDAAHYFKGIPVLLKALLVLKKNELRAQAVLVGEGEWRKRYELQAKGYGLGESVRFAGRVADEELPYYYNLTDLFVLPSLNQGEAFGMALLEAMASGVPVVASDLPGVRTVAADGGMMVKPKNPYDLAEAIAGYFASNNNRAEWVSHVRQVVEEKYSWGAIVRRLEALYMSLVK